MKYELNENEVKFIEKLRDLLPELQDALFQNADTLFRLQATIAKEMIDIK